MALPLVTSSDLPMHAAAAALDVAALAALHGTDAGLVNGADRHGMTPLHWAARHDDQGDTVAWLLDQGAAPKAMVGGLAPLHYAVMHGNVAGAERILSAGGYVNGRDAFGNTVMDQAERMNGSEAMLSVLASYADQHPSPPRPVPRGRGAARPGGTFGGGFGRQNARRGK